MLIRPLAESDSLEELTGLLHRAYKRLADMGLKYYATHQSPEATRERTEKGTCLVGLMDARLVATLVFYDLHQTDGCPWYEREDVAHFGQFAVDPELQNRGLGSRMMDRVEDLACERGAPELALDTAERAQHLIHYYERRGYRRVGHADWRPLTNYRSVILSRALR